MVIIPEDERHPEGLEGPDVLTHPDMNRACEWILSDAYSPPVRDFVVFVPCSKVKPYHISPSHRNYDKVIFSILSPEEVHVVVFGTCGVTPRELDEDYPFMNYKFMLGRCDIREVKESFVLTESERLSRYLIKTKNNYKHRIAFCLGDFRKAMVIASEKARKEGIEVRIVPSDTVMEENALPAKVFKYGSLSRKPYLQELADTLCSLKNLPKKVLTLTDESTHDHDWFLV